MGSLSPKKKLAFFLLSLIAIWSISEITSFTLYFVLTGKIFPLTEYHLAIRRAGREKAIAREQAQWNRQASYTVDALYAAKERASRTIISGASG